jgi:hypothetical protein
LWLRSNEISIAWFGGAAVLYETVKTGQSGVPTIGQLAFASSVSPASFPILTEPAKKRQFG